MKKIACKSYRKKLLKAFERYRENAMNGASRLIDKDMVWESIRKMKNDKAAGPLAGEAETLTGITKNEVL